MPQFFTDNQPLGKLLSFGLNLKRQPHEEYTLVPTRDTNLRTKETMRAPRRTQYFYNILLLIGLSLILYLFSGQLLSQGRGSSGGDGSDSVTSGVSSSSSNLNANHVVSAYGSFSNAPAVISSRLKDISKQYQKTGQLSSVETNNIPVSNENDNAIETFTQRGSSSGGSNGKLQRVNLDKVTSASLTSTNNVEDAPTPKDWIRLFSETAHKLYSMFSPDHLKEFRKWAVKQQRQSIAREMKGYKFQFGKNTKTEDLILETGGQPIRNVIFTTWRSGSTFLGEVLHSHPGTFYHYEPLLHFDIKQVRSGPLAKEGLRVINQLLNCNYTGLSDFMSYGKTHHWLFSHNSRVWQYCEKSYDVCWDAKFLSEMCKLFPFQSVKTVRMRLRLAKTLLENKKFNIRLLLLVRDPRGTMQSRNHRVWCPEDPDCYDPSKLCMDMVDDFNYAEKLRLQYPDRFLSIRYEDMSLSPYDSMQKIFKFFRLQYHPQVDKFLSSHTVENVGGVSSTFRDSKTTPFHWRNDFVGNFSLVTNIQHSCKAAMKLWGYNDVSDEDKLLIFNPLKKPPWPEMLVLNSTQVHDQMYVA